MMEILLAERRSPFYSSIVGLGATMGRVGGDFISAKHYSGIADEHLNTRKNVGVQDLSTMGKMDIKGADAEALVNHVIVNDAAAMGPGQVRYSTVCREDGGIMDDLTVFRLGAEHFMLVTGSVNRLKMLPWLQHHAQGRRPYVTDITAAVAFPTIQGPRSRDLLKAMISDADLDELKRWAFTSGHINGTRVLISRTGVTGELGFELFVPADEATSVWDALMRTGQAFGLKPYGVLAMFTLGLERPIRRTGSTWTRRARRSMSASTAGSSSIKAISSAGTRCSRCATRASTSAGPGFSSTATSRRRRMHG